VHFAQWLFDEQITVYQSSPTAFRHLTASAPAHDRFPHLRLIRLDGEAVYKSDIDVYRENFSRDCILVNSLSSTETGTVSLYYADHSTPVVGTRLPAGYPVSGKEVLLLDENGIELGIEQTGEIAVKSRFLAAGYWRTPELTADKFLNGPGSREIIYLTGDLGCRTKDGCLELAGRKDCRVKIRNFTVDLAEIEALLAEHPNVKHAAAIHEENQKTDPRIVAYVVPRDQPAPTVSQLRRFARERLPEYMVPSVFIVLEGLPLLGSGKLDRRALPRPDQLRPNLDNPYSPPRNLVENELAKIWAQFLSLDRIGIHDNFYELGGNSLTATRIVSEVIRTFQREIPLDALLGAPTVAHMAATILSHQEQDPARTDMAQIVEELEALREEEAGQFLSGTTGARSYR
jgi:acyl carrier protein